MPPHADIAHGAMEGVEIEELASSEAAELKPGTPLADELEAIVTLELNFNAYADHVPPTKHARRVAKHNDPSVQDFADQALELAALRAELKRLNRDYDSLRQTVRMRDAQVQALREELSALHARTPRNQSLQSRTTEVHAKVDEASGRDSMLRASTSKPEMPMLAGHETTIVDDPLIAQELSSTVVLPAGMPVASSANGADRAATVHHQSDAGTACGRSLVPLDHEGQAIPLNRDIVTIGRTRQSDICIPSRAVSRDHARLLLGPSAVMLFDRDSANGCFVNDEPVKRQKLRNGDRVRIGDRTYRFVAATAAQRRVSS